MDREKYQYHHIGIPVHQPVEGKIYLPELKLFYF